jgi:carbon-monoxide dehydrogenase large subunit
MTSLKNHSPDAQSFLDANQGHTFARQEDLRLITGRGQFTADYAYPGMLYLHVIRSVHAHAKIKSIDLSAVRSSLGVQLVLTHEDMSREGAQDLPHAVTLTSITGEPQKINKMPVLAKGKVHFVGQPIAFVVANTALQAQDAAELAQIDFEVLDACADVVSTLAHEAPVLHEGMSGNVSCVFSSGDLPSVEQAFAHAAHVSEVRVNSQRLIGFPMEPRAVVAKYDAQTGQTTIHTPSQGLLSIQGYLSQTTGLKPEQMHIVTQDVGGSFGLRTAAYSEHVGVVIASRLLGAAVKWVGSRSEVFLSDWHGRALALNGRIALDQEGHILAIRFDDEVDVGAYNCYMSSFIGSRNLSVTMGGVYKVPALYMQSTIVYTNTVPTSAYRGAGRPDIAYAVERLVDFAAHEHGFDPVEIRRKNFIALNDFPYKTANGTMYDTCDFNQVLNKALELSNYQGFEGRRAQSMADGKLRGLGLSTYLEASGAGNVQKDQVDGQFTPEGLLVISGVTGASGQGHETSFAKIVENELGLAPEFVKYQAGVHGLALIGNGTGGSRTLYGAGSAIKNLCATIRLQLSKALAEQWSCELEEVRFHEGLWSHSSQEQTLLSTHQVLTSLTKESLLALSAIGEAQSGATYPNGCHVAELEVDPETGEVAILNYVSVDELGRVISPQLVQGQVHGGVIQGFGQAFCEEVVYDQQGQLLSGSLMDYALPRAGGLPVIKNETLEVQTQLNLLGAKGVGESGCTGSLPALANALMSALRPLGIDRMDMPFTPMKVWTAIQEAKNKTQTRVH